MGFGSASTGRSGRIAGRAILARSEIGGSRDDGRLARRRRVTRKRSRKGWGYTYLSWGEACDGERVNGRAGRSQNGQRGEDNG